MNSKIVLDSSVIVKWLNITNESHIDIADQIMESAIKRDIELIAPDLAKYEIANVLLKGKKLTQEEAKISLTTLYSLPIAFINESFELSIVTYTYAHKLGITYYDASFLSLAKKYNATLITENIKHQKKTSEIDVVSLADYKR